MKSLSICGLFCLIALAGCGPKSEEAPGSGEAQAVSENPGEAAYENPPIGMLKSNDHQIILHSGPEGPLYSVRGPDGEELAKEISKAELQASFPDLNMSEIWAEATVLLERKTPDYPLIMEPMPGKPLNATR